VISFSFSSLQVNVLSCAVPLLVLFFGLLSSLIKVVPYFPLDLGLTPPLLERQLMFRPTLRNMTKFDIEIVSDSVCPWCYVGWRKLQAGIQEFKKRHGEDDTFSTTFKPFYLNPDASKEGVDKQKYYEERFGKDRTAMMQQRLSQIGASVGINFAYGGRSGNTRDSHRLVQLGKTKSPEEQTKVVEALFTFYFENEQDITSLAVLEAAGVKAGLEEAEVKDWLQSEADHGGKEVDLEVLEARRKRITGVPNFTVNGLFEVGGAQDPDVFVDLFERIKANEGKETIKVEGGGSC